MTEAAPTQAASTQAALTEALALTAEALGLRPEDLTPEAAVGDPPEWDSLAHVRLLLAAEARLGRRLTSAEIAGFGSAADLAAILARG